MNGMEDYGPPEPRKSSIKGILIGCIVGGFAVACIAFGGFMFTGSQHSAERAEKDGIISGLMAEVGKGEARLQEEKVKFAREYEYLIQTVEAEIDRINKGCEAIYSGYSAATQIAFQLESELVQTKARALTDGNTGRNIVTSLGDMGCAFGRAIEGQDNVLCGVSQSTRQDSMREYNVMTMQGRPRVLNDMMASIPTCHDLLSTEFLRVKREMLENEYPMSGDQGGQNG